MKEFERKLMSGKCDCKQCKEKRKIANVKFKCVDCKKIFSGKYYKLRDHHPLCYSCRYPSYGDSPE